MGYMRRQERSVQEAQETSDIRLASEIIHTKEAQTWMPQKENSPGRDTVLFANKYILV
jgi:hypothetical protein